jgi:hypothetical protein
VNYRSKFDSKWAGFRKMPFLYAVVARLGPPVVMLAEHRSGQSPDFRQGLKRGENDSCGDETANDSGGLFDYT